MVGRQGSLFWNIIFRIWAEPGPKKGKSIFGDKKPLFHALLSPVTALLCLSTGSKSQGVEGMQLFIFILFWWDRQGLVQDTPRSDGTFFSPRCTRCARGGAGYQGNFLRLQTTWLLPKIAREIGTGWDGPTHCFQGDHEPAARSEHRHLQHWGLHEVPDLRRETAGQRAGTGMGHPLCLALCSRHRIKKWYCEATSFDTLYKSHIIKLLLDLSPKPLLLVCFVQQKKCIFYAIW